MPLTYENTQIHYLPACANVDAPTQAEITAGTDLTAFVPTDGGFTNSPTQNKASEAFLGEGFISEAIGTDGDSLTLVFKREEVTADDDAWELIDKHLTGFILRAPFDDTAATARVQVFPVEFGRKQMQAVTANAIQKFTVETAVTGLPGYDAVAAA